MECTVCLEAFDHEARRPKSLPCGHSFCLLCLQNPAINNLCPQDRQAFEADPMTLPDNFALLAAEVRAKGVWCEFCRRQYGAECADAGHRPYSQRQRQTAQQQLGAGVAELRRELEELRRSVEQPSRGVAELRRELEELRRLGPSVAELRRELQETQRQVLELQQRGAQPAPRLELDVKEVSSTRRLRRERNDLLLGDQLTQVRCLFGLDCGVDAAWAEAVLLKVGPHVEELHNVDNVQLQHLRAIQGMPALKTLHLRCWELDANADVPLLPLQLEDLTVEEVKKNHLLSLQWMPKLRKVYLIGCIAQAPLTFSPMPGHCGIREMTLGFFPTSTLLSLVRAHAATLRVLHVNIASSDRFCNFRPKFSRQLHECGLVALRELKLYRNEFQHDEPSCRVQIPAFRARFGPNVVVRCSECDYEACSCV